MRQPLLSEGLPAVPEVEQTTETELHRVLLNSAYSYVIFSLPVCHLFIDSRTS